MESISPAARLDTARNVWLATVRPDGRPHLVPVWFVVAAERWYFCTAPGSVKARNLGRNRHVSMALEDGSEPYIIEGQAREISPSPAVIDLFKAKYAWDLTTESEYTIVFEVAVDRKLMVPAGS